MDLIAEDRPEIYQAILNNANQDGGFVQYSGVRCTKLDKLYCEGELTVTPDVLNRWGVVHGGCLATLADTVAGVAACTAGKRAMTLSCNLNFLRPAVGSKIKCVAEAVKVGKTVAVMRAVLTNDQDRTVATGDFTFFYTEGSIDQLLTGVPTE